MLKFNLFILLLISRIFSSNKKVQSSQRQIEEEEKLKSNNNKYQEFCLSRRGDNEILQYGDNLIKSRKSVFTISIKSLQNQYIIINERMNQLINQYSEKYIKSNIKKSNYFFQKKIKILDANKKRKLANISYKNQNKFGIEVEEQYSFYLNLTLDKLSVHFDKEGKYGALLEYKICEIQQMISEFSEEQVIRELNNEKCVSIFNRYSTQMSNVIICLESEKEKQKMIQLVSVYKSYCYPNIRIIPKASFAFQADFSLKHPLYVFHLYFYPALDSILSDNKLTSFYLTSDSIYYQTYQYMFTHDNEPIHLLYKHIINYQDNPQSCCQNIQFYQHNDEDDDNHNQVKDNIYHYQNIYKNNNNNKDNHDDDDDNQDAFQYCVIIKKDSHHFQWKLCSDIQSNINKFMIILQQLIKKYLLINTQFPNMYSQQQNQFSINTAYDFLQAFTHNQDEGDQQCHDDNETDNNIDQINLNNIHMKKQDEYEDIDPDFNSNNFDEDESSQQLRYKVLSQLQNLEDFSQKLLARQKLRPNLFEFLKNKLKILCRQRKNYSKIKE